MKKFTINEIATLVEMNIRKVRYYIQNGLVDNPEGSRKGAYYTHTHLEQLLAIRKWKDAGLSLERIQELLSNQKSSTTSRALPPRKTRPGSIEVWSHIHIADGIELRIDPQQASINNQQIRQLLKKVINEYQDIVQNEDK